MYSLYYVEEVFFCSMFLKCFCHESDHLDGILYIDKATKMFKDRDEYGEYKEKHEKQQNAKNNTNKSKNNKSNNKK